MSESGSKENRTPEFKVEPTTSSESTKVKETSRSVESAKPGENTKPAEGAKPPSPERLSTSGTGRVGEGAAPAPDRSREAATGPERKGTAEQDRGARAEAPKVEKVPEAADRLKSGGGEQGPKGAGEAGSRVEALEARQVKQQEAVREKNQNVETVKQQIREAEAHRPGPEQKADHERHVAKLHGEHARVTGQAVEARRELQKTERELKEAKKEQPSTGSETTKVKESQRTPEAPRAGENTKPAEGAKPPSAERLSGTGAGRTGESAASTPDRNREAATAPERKGMGEQDRVARAEGSKAGKAPEAADRLKSGGGEQGPKDAGEAGSRMDARREPAEAKKEHASTGSETAKAKESQRAVEAPKAVENTKPAEGAKPPSPERLSTSGTGRVGEGAAPAPDRSREAATSPERKGTSEQDRGERAEATKVEKVEKVEKVPEAADRLKSGGGEQGPKGAGETGSRVEALEARQAKQQETVREKNQNVETVKQQIREAEAHRPCPEQKADHERHVAKLHEEHARVTGQAVEARRELQKTERELTEAKKEQASTSSEATKDRESQRAAEASKAGEGTKPAGAETQHKEDRKIIGEEGSLRANWPQERIEKEPATALHEMMDEAWARREDKDRFDVGGKTAVLYSGFASSSEQRRTELGKEPTERIHSGELAAHHRDSHPDTHVTISDTVGGKDLEYIQQRVNSSVVDGADRERLQNRLDELWKDGSERLAKSARDTSASLGYVENARENGVYRSTERPTLELGTQHRHLTDVPLVDGRPPAEDKLLPGDLDKNGRYYQAS
jgi:hypothetical protein